MTHKEKVIEMVKAIILAYVFGVCVSLEINPAEWWAIGRMAAIVFLLWIFSVLYDMP